MTPKKLTICIPSAEYATKLTVQSLEQSEPLLKAAGYEVTYADQKGNAYISAARATMLRAALTAKADIIVFVDDDVSWVTQPEALLKLVETEGEVVGGTYRAREDHTNFMGRPIQTPQGRLTSIRNDGCIEMATLPAGFLKITRSCVYKFMRGYPQLCYGEPWNYSVDLFNHGARDGLWWGEDYAFCRRWRDLKEQVWCLANINLDHGGREKFDVHTGKKYLTPVLKGNYHEFWLRQPGGAKEGQPYPDADWGYPDAKDWEPDAS